MNPLIVTVLRAILSLKIEQGISEEDVDRGEVMLDQVHAGEAGKGAAFGRNVLARTVRRVQRSELTRKVYPFVISSRQSWLGTHYLAGCLRDLEVCAMRPIRRKPMGRAVEFTLLLLLTVLSGAWCVLRVSLLLKTREAKLLLSQVKAFRLRESTFQDAKNLADQYDGKVDYQGKPCTFEDCTFTILLPHSGRKQPSSAQEALQSIGRFVGIRAYMVEGSISVRHGRIMETSFMVDTEAKLGTTTGQWLSAEVKASDRFPPPTSYYFGHQEGLDDHPNRKVVHPTLTIGGGGQVIWSEVTADANSTERTRAFDINLSCLSSLAGCSELRQLAPSAWEDLMALSWGEGKRRAEPRDYGECSSRSLAWLARDMNSVFLVEVRKVFPVNNVVDSLQDVDFGVIEVLKGQAPKNLSRFPLEVFRADAVSAGRGSSLPSRIFSPRNQLLLFLDDAVSLPYPRCEVVRASEENLAMVRQTVRQLAQGMPISALTE